MFTGPILNLVTSYCDSKGIVEYPWSHAIVKEFWVYRFLTNTKIQTLTSKQVAPMEHGRRDMDYNCSRNRKKDVHYDLTETRGKWGCHRWRRKQCTSNGYGDGSTCPCMHMPTAPLLLPLHLPQILDLVAAMSCGRWQHSTLKAQVWFW